LARRWIFRKISPQHGEIPMSWIHQGRQEHGWFGHGRAPQPPPSLRLARMDGLPGGHPAGTQTLRARYVAANPEQWIGRDSVGSGECVDLVKAAAGTPPTKFLEAGSPGDG
jgi:hypothetical protein